MSGRRRNTPWPERLRIGLVIVAVAASLTACDKAGDEEAEYPSQSKLEPIKGIPGHHTVTLTPLGAKQVGIQTTAVAGSDKLRELPYDALLYGADGTTFVYTSPKALTFRYAEVKLEKIVGERIYFSEGPDVGTRVVTRGEAQVHGADIELEFGEIA